jgi:hypothetical protein
MPWMVRINASSTFQTPDSQYCDLTVDGIIYRDACDERQGCARGQQSVPFLVWRCADGRDGPKDRAAILRHRGVNGEWHFCADAAVAVEPHEFPIPPEVPMGLMDVRRDFLVPLWQAADKLEHNVNKHKLKRRLAVAKAQIRSLMEYHRRPRSLHVRLDFVQCQRLLRLKERSPKCCFGANIQDWLQKMDLPPVQLRLKHLQGLERLGREGEVLRATRLHHSFPREPRVSMPRAAEVAKRYESARAMASRRRRQTSPHGES